jgi:hypothetical protein
MESAPTTNPRQLTKEQLRVKSKPTKPSATIQSHSKQIWLQSHEPKWEREEIAAPLNPKTDAQHRQVARFERKKLEVEEGVGETIVETARQRQRRKQELKALRKKLFGPANALALGKASNEGGI